FSKALIGVSAQFSNEIMHRIKDADDPYETLQYIFKNIMNHEYNYVTYFDENGPKDFYCIDLKYIHHTKNTIFDTPSKQIEEFYMLKDSIDRLKAKTSSLSKLVQLNMEKCEKKILIMENILSESSEKYTLKLYGELLTANIHLIKNKDKEITVENYYDENLSKVTIPLDEFKTPSQNIQSYYKKYNKMKRSEEMAEKQIKLLKSEIEYLNTVYISISRCENSRDIEDIKQELTNEGYIKIKTKSKKTKETPSKPMHFLSSEGIDIYVGKNNTQNDYLTLKFANKSDIWLHAKDIPGSHVILKHNSGEIPEKSLIEAAKLAALYSKAKEDTKINIDYTIVKNVKKPNGAKAGMVIYDNYKTLNIKSTMPQGIKKLK
ncbi:MAG: NFACT family protein, partial [Oscillospiraceae bacterium]|nr:NFACT family protein [Oscillospiraceae bacterium]